MDLKQREERRKEAVRRLRAGESAAVIAHDLGVAANSVYEWGKKARTGGLKALATRPGRGRPPKLSREHWKQLKRMVLKGPRACGFERELWTLPMIKELIEREHGVEYHEDQDHRRPGVNAHRARPAALAVEDADRAARAGRAVHVVGAETQNAIVCSPDGYASAMSGRWRARTAVVLGPSLIDAHGDPLRLYPMVSAELIEPLRDHQETSI